MITKLIDALLTIHVKHKRKAINISRYETDEPAKTTVQAIDYLRHQSLVIEEQSGHVQQPRQHVETWSPSSTVKL